jgi:hypothetical protein
MHSRAMTSAARSLNVFGRNMFYVILFRINKKHLIKCMGYDTHVRAFLMTLCGLKVHTPMQKITNKNRLLRAWCIIFLSEVELHQKIKYALGHFSALVIFFLTHPPPVYIQQFRANAYLQVQIGTEQKRRGLDKPQVKLSR